MKCPNCGADLDCLRKRRVVSKYYLVRIAGDGKTPVQEHLKGYDCAEGEEWQCDECGARVFDTEEQALRALRAEAQEKAASPSGSRGCDPR